jgi:methylphosphotriester-DNA--protein-cysteine methyltransferase
VSSTGIFCRSSCPARLARRANVGFFDTAADASAAGFRPCKRCKPELAGGQPEDAAIIAIKAFVVSESSKRQFLTLRQMADQAGLSKWHFHRTFVKVTGMTPGEWAKQQKQIVANENLTSTTVPPHPSMVFDFANYSPGNSSVTATTPTSLGSAEDFDQILNLDATDEDWLKMIDFEALAQSIDFDCVSTCN